MSSPHAPILRVAVPVPLRRSFDYLGPKGSEARHFHPGCRLHVPFGKSGTTVGMLVGVDARSKLPRERLKTAGRVIDSEPVIAPAHLRFLLWASDYYQHPVGEVLFGALPARLRRGLPARGESRRVWRLLPGPSEPVPPGGRRAPRQDRVLDLLRKQPTGVPEIELLAEPGVDRSTMAALRKKGLVDVVEEPASPQTAARIEAVRLNAEQQAAVDRITGSSRGFQAFLLNGIAGSGKTEVYLELIRTINLLGRQALILVPEIGLTPQFIDRIRRRINSRVRVMHSGLSETERLQAWLDARDGTAGVVLGTRSAVWAPLKHPGIFIVDEEHDLSYKQHDGFRYSARDVAVVRARDAGVPIVLGSATPSLESIHNAAAARYQEIRLSNRYGTSAAPGVEFIDLRGQAMDGALSLRLVSAIEDELAARHQVMLFLNRRGFSPVMMCHACGWIAGCRRCDLPLTYHKKRNVLLCHHCGLKIAPPRRCAQCDAPEILQIGHGTERLAETLAARFSGARILRIDRDSTRRRGAMDRMVESINAGDADILVGTQMLAKGHHFERLTLVGIIDADRGLFSVDFRAAERMAQQLVQVSGRAGRAEHAGRVLIQTHYPDHPLLTSLVNHGYEQFARLALEERRHARLPPFSFLALLRAEHFEPGPAEQFLREARGIIENHSAALELYGPFAAPMERRAGRHRAQLLIQSSQRSPLVRALAACAPEIEELRSARRVRWSLDVDPQDML
ncbi:MAG: primosomal protein N' [Gammaproteobacteria bacterium]|nr:primosomal protein N' [Gammaproteobacteria bacterium]